MISVTELIFIILCVLIVPSVINFLAYYVWLKRSRKGEMTLEDLIKALDEDLYIIFPGPSFAIAFTIIVVGIIYVITYPFQVLAKYIYKKYKHHKI